MAASSSHTISHSLTTLSAPPTNRATSTCSPLPPLSINQPCDHIALLSIRGPRHLFVRPRYLTRVAAGAPASGPSRRLALGGRPGRKLPRTRHVASHKDPLAVAAAVRSLTSGPPRHSDEIRAHREYPSEAFVEARRPRERPLFVGAIGVRLGERMDADGGMAVASRTGLFPSSL